MSESLRQYTSLTRALLKNSIATSKLVRKEVSSNGKKSGKTGAIVAVIITVFAFAILGASSAITMTLSALESGIVEEILYAFLAIAQLMVFFFGSLTVLGNLYYSKDNALLAGMPFRSGVVFSAKFTVSYLEELAFAGLVLVPTLTASGITLMVSGYELSWTFFLMEAFAVVLVPAVPLLLASIVSLPLMFIVSALKKRSFGNGIVTAIFYVIALVLYFAFIAFVGGSEEGGFDSQAVSAFGVIKNITLFNYPMVNALLGVSNGFLWLFAYMGGVIVVTAGAVAVSAVFYKKAMTASSEASETAYSHKSRAESGKRSPMSALFLKELKTLVNTPTLLLSAVMSIVMPVIVMFFYSKLLDADFSEIETTFGANGINMYTVSILTFISYMFVATTNQVASIGFSREGKNIYMLKALPISASLIVNVKLLFATSITAISAIVAGVALPFVSGITNPVGAIGYALTVFVGGFASNCISLYNDLKAPNFKWTNINEVTKNNNRMLRPMLLSFAINIVCMVIGIVMGLVNVNLSDSAVLAIFYGIYLLASAGLAGLYYYKLSKDKKELYERIGG